MMGLLKAIVKIKKQFDRETTLEKNNKAATYRRVCTQNLSCLSGKMLSQPTGNQQSIKIT